MFDRNYHYEYLNSSVFTKTIKCAFSHNITNSLETKLSYHMIAAVLMPSEKLFYYIAVNNIINIFAYTTCFVFCIDT